VQRIKDRGDSLDNVELTMVIEEIFVDLWQ